MQHAQITIPFDRSQFSSIIFSEFRFVEPGKVPNGFHVVYDPVDIAQIKSFYQAEAPWLVLDDDDYLRTNRDANSSRAERLLRRDAARREQLAYGPTAERTILIVRAKDIPKPIAPQIPADWNYRCQFCGNESPAKDWRDNDICPLCGSKYD